MLIHEFTTKSVAGYYLIVLFTTYGLFLTFSVILDSMQDQETADRRDGIHGYNFLFRVGMHTMTVVLAAMSFWIKGCSPTLFPDAFVGLAVYIAFYTLFTLYLHREHHNKNHLFDEDCLPKSASVNNLRYNLDLFKQQFEVLRKVTIVFSLISLALIGLGVYLDINQANVNTRNDFVCINGNEWAFITPLGNLYGVILSMIILCQINASQYILIRIPLQRGDIFIPKAQIELKSSLLNKLIVKAD